MELELDKDKDGPRVSAQVNQFYTIICNIFDHLDENDIQDILVSYDDDEEEDEMDIDEFVQARSEDIKDRERFFRAVSSGQDDMEAAEKFLEVIQKLNLHASDGQKFVELIAFIEEMQKDGIQSYEVFVGRDKDVKELVEDIKSKNRAFGISISAIGGQGKSTVAKHVCRKIREEGWDVIKVDLRERTTLSDTVQSLLIAAGQTCSEYADPSELWTFMEQINKCTLFCLDDCDSFLEREGNRGKSFLNDLLKKSTSRKDKPIIKFLMTARQKLNCKNRSLTDMFVEHELQPLEIESAVELLKRCSEKDDFEGEIEYAIVNECACSPLGISVVAELIKNGKFTPQRLLVHLQLDKRNVTEALRINSCLNQGIENLDLNFQKCLVALSVFQSQVFTQRNAHRVLLNISASDVNVILDSLCEAHLLNKEDTPSKEYSLHPLVYRYLKEWKLSKEMQAAFDCAICNFVDLYEEIISKIVKRLDSDCMKGIVLLEEHRSHLMYFYDILLDKKNVLKPYAKRSGQKDVLRKKRLSDLADLLLSDVKKRRLFESESLRAKASGNKDMQIFWTVEHADVFVMLHDKPQIGMELLDSLTNGRFAGLRNLHADRAYQPLVHSLFHKVKGLSMWKLQRFDDAVEHLQLALHFLGMCSRQNHSCFIAKVSCAIGEVYLQKGDLDKAKDNFTTGLLTVRSLIQSDRSKNDENRKESEDTRISGPDMRLTKVERDLQWDIPRFFTKLGNLNLKKARLAESEADREKYLDVAQDYLEYGMDLDRKMKLDKLDGFFEKMKLRADVFIEKGLLMEALKDSETASDCRRNILQPPHLHYTESVYQLALVFMLIGNSYVDKNIEKARQNWDTSSAYFSELEEHHLIDGGISLNHPLFKEIKQNHLKLAELQGDKKMKNRVEKLYKKLESGGFMTNITKRLKAYKEMVYTPMEIVQRMFNAGGSHFGEMEPVLQQIEDEADEQMERMMRGEPAGGRKDSGMGGSSSDLESSESSGSGSLSAHVSRMKLQQSMSLEDDVFKEVSDNAVAGSTDHAVAGSSDLGASGDSKPSAKRQKTLS